MSISRLHAIRHKFYTLRSTLSSSALTLHFSLFLFLLAVYLLTYTPRINSSDGLAMFSTAESLARRGTFDIEQIRWMDLQQGTYGLDGLLYSRKGVGLPLGLLPLTWLGLVIPWLGPVSVSLLFNAIVTALTAVLLLAYLKELGFNPRTGLIIALTFGLTTLAWPYAKSLFSDPFSGLLLLAAAYFLLKFRRREQQVQQEINNYPRPLLWRYPIRFNGYLVGSLTYLFLAGLCLGWNIATRYAEALFVPVYSLLLLYYLFATRYRWQITMGYLLVFFTPLALTALGLIAFNLSRYGDPFNTGYLPNETFSGVWWQGLIGQLVSPGRGLLLYCPVFILSLVGLPAAWRRLRGETLLALTVITLHLLLYGKWFMWHGGYAWGPRFMIPTLPFWAILLAPVVERAFVIKTCQVFKNLTGLLRIAFITLAILGLIPQLLSIIIDFTPFQNSLLDTGLPLFASATFFDPHYSPFLRAWSFITPPTLDLAWMWQGQFNGWLLAVLAANVAITGFYLSQVSGITSPVSRITFSQPFGNHQTTKPPNPAVTTLLPLVSSLLSTLFLLTYTHTLVAPPLSQAITALNEATRPTDAIITNDPETAMPFAERYKGRAPVLGLNNGGFPLPANITRRLSETTANHQQVWWLPNWLPPEESAIEQTLLTTGFKARQDTFNEQRLALFAFPANMTNQLEVNKVTFEDKITLKQVNYPSSVAPGAAFPVELRWQAIQPTTEDYHVFIHLVNAAGQVVAQADGQPALWTRPTSTWRPGDIIVDRYGLWLSPQLAPGDYTLFSGLYRPADNRRLHLSDGADSVKLHVTVR